MPALPISNVGHFRFTRGDDDDDADSNSTINILTIVLAIIVALGVILLGALFILKRTRRQRNQRNSNSPPQYNDVVQQDKNHHRLTIETRGGGRTSIMYNKDGRPMLANPNSPPHSPDNVPEIHITFPDEEADEQGGKRKSGRVVVVRVGDGAAVGLEPLDEDELPAYEKESNGSFYSIDMDDIGGLREKEREDYH